jgi:hypothetical protein
MASWPELLRAAAARARPIPPRTRPEAEVEPAARGVGGCLLRLVLFMVFVFLALFGGLFVFGASVLQMFGRF